MNNIPDCKHLTHQIKLCLNGGVCKYKRCDHIYDRIIRKISDQVDVSGDGYKMKQRRLIWTTYRNINIWFETLKRFLIDKYFLREKTYEYRLVLSEIVYFESKSNIIINLDKREVSTDVTSKLPDGRPLTKLLLEYGDLTKGATISNKSGYSSTFIEGSTLAV